MMQALAEGLALIDGKDEFDLDVAAIAEMWRHGSVVRSWLLDLTADFLREDSALTDVAPLVADSGEGRWTVRRGGRAGCARAGAHARADDALRKSGAWRLRQQAAGDDAQELRRSSRRQRRRHDRRAAMIVVLMGVCGCGKTTVGRALAIRSAGPFSMPTISIHRRTSAKMAAGDRAHRRRSLAVARSSARRAARASTRAARTRCSRARRCASVTASACPSAARRCASSISRATSPPSSPAGHRAAGISCQRRCSRASSPRWRSPREALVIDIRQRRRRAGRADRAGARAGEWRASACKRRDGIAGDRGHAARPRPAQAPGRGEHAGLSRDHHRCSIGVADLEVAMQGDLPRRRPTDCTACRPSPTCNRRSRRSRAGMRRWPCLRVSPRSRWRCWRPPVPATTSCVSDSVYGPTRRFCDNQLSGSASRSPITIR